MSRSRWLLAALGRPGNADLNARVKLPQPCIAPVVFVFGAPNVGWFAATGS